MLDKLRGLVGRLGGGGGAARAKAGPATRQTGGQHDAILRLPGKPYRRRKQNQDRMGYSFTRDALLLVLADGMGGHAHGEVAATVALQTISLLFQQQAQPYVKKPQRFLEEALQAAHRDIHRHRQVKG
jgi:serine/threonine protein phosphatase PrpC